MAYNSLPTPNNAGYVGPWVTTYNDSIPSEPVLIELAQALIATEGLTPLTDLFPEETILERNVIIQQSFEGVDTIFPLVEAGLPDVVLGSNQGATRSFPVQPLFIRRSGSFSYAKINNQVIPGTNTRKPRAQIIQDEMTRMTREHNLTWDVYRAFMLLGGINYTDPRTGVSARVSSRIPAHNLMSFNTLNGWRGRNEANLFRSIVDQHAPEPSTAGVPWTHPDADIAHCIRRLKRWFKQTNKSDLTDLYLHPDLFEVISMNTQIRLYDGGLLPRFNTTTGERGDEANVTTGMIIPQGFDSPTRQALTFAGNELSAIAGVRINKVDTKFKDPVDGIYKHVWPKNKVVLASKVDSQGRAEAPGRTQYCIGEDEERAGVWVRMNTETQIPAAPGMYVQMGNAGLPYLKYPYRVMHLNVASVDSINDRLGVLGDLDFGTY